MPYTTFGPRYSLQPTRKRLPPYLSCLDGEPLNRIEHSNACLAIALQRRADYEAERKMGNSISLTTSQGSISWLLPISD